MSSPIIYEKHAYVHLRNQRFACIDLSNGDIKWQTEPFGKYWSMVAAKDRIMALDQNGTLMMIEATPEKFNLLGKLKVSSQETWAHIGVAEDEVFVRELKGMSVFTFAK